MKINYNSREQFKDEFSLIYETYLSGAVWTDRLIGDMIWNNSSKTAIMTVTGVDFMVAIKCEDLRFKRTLEYLWWEIGGGMGMVGFKALVEFVKGMIEKKEQENYFMYGRHNYKISNPSFEKVEGFRKPLLSFELEGVE